MKIETKFDIGQTVYLITDKEQLMRIVTGIYIRQGGELYTICMNTETSDHYDYEMSDEKDITKTF